MVPAFARRVRKRALQQRHPLILDGLSDSASRSRARLRRD